MRRATLTRIETGDEGTFGQLLTDSGFFCMTLELPWRNNEKGRSCIPAGTYTFFWRTDSPAHGACYEALPSSEAPGRENIQVHAANLAGDELKGFVAQLLGCIAPGKAIVKFAANVKPAGPRDQRGITESGATTRALQRDLGLNQFELTVKWAPGVGPAGEKNA